MSNTYCSHIFLNFSVGNNRMHFASIMELFYLGNYRSFVKSAYAHKTQRISFQEHEWISLYGGHRNSVTFKNLRYVIPNTHSNESPNCNEALSFSNIVHKYTGVLLHFGVGTDFRCTEKGWLFPCEKLSMLFVYVWN